MDEKNQDDIRSRGDGEQRQQNAESPHKRQSAVNWLDSHLANSGSLWLRYGAAILAVAIAILIDKEDFLSGEFRIYLVFYPFIILATLYGGIGPGLLAITLSCLSVSFFWVEPVGKFAMASRADRVSMAIFIIGNLFFIGICERLRRAIRQAAQGEAHRENAVKLAQQAQILKESEQRSSLAQKAGHVGIFDWDILSGKIIWSPEQEELFGLPIGSFEQTYDAWAKRIHPDDETRLTPYFNEWIQSDREEEKECQEYRIPLPDGQFRWIEAQGRVIRDPEGRAVRLIGTNRDVTERHRVEEELQGRERQLKEAQRVAHMGSWQWDPHTDTATWSEELYRIFGRDPKLPLPGYSERASSYSPESWAQLDAAVKKVLETGKSYQLTLEYIQPDGTRKWIAFRGEAVRNAAGHVTRLIGTAQDITENKQAEEALRASEAKFRIVADNTYDWEFWMSPEGKFLYTSPSCLRITGHTAEEFQADPELFIRILHPDDQSAYLHHRTYVTESKTADKIEFRVIRLDGTERWIAHTCQPIFSDEGQYLGMRGSNRDVTERKQAEEALRESEAFSVSLRDSLIEHIVVIDEHGYIIAVNREWQQFAEKNGAPELAENSLGLNYLAVCEKAAGQPKGEEAAAARDGILAVLNGVQADFHLEYPCHSPDQKRWFQMHVCPLRGERKGVVIAHLDITKRWLAEETLRENQEQLRLLVEQAPITVAMFDRNMNYIATSRRWIAEYGRGNTDLTGLNHYDVKYDMPDYWREVHRKALEGEAQECEEDRWVQADGTVNWLRWAVHPWRDTHQQIGGLIISTEDITKRKLAEEALRQSAALLRAVCETTPAPIFAKDRESRILMANPATLKIFGKPLQEVLGRRDDELYSDPETARAVLENDRRVIESGVAEVFEETIETPYGKRVFLSTKAPYLDADGRVIGTIGVARDITERKESEEALQKSEARVRATFDNAGVGIIETEKDDRLIAANDRVCEILGYTREELLNMTVHDLTVPEDRELSRRINAEIHEGIRDRVGYEKRYLKRDGSPLWVHVTVSGVRDADGKWSRSVTTVEDISERKQAVEALKQAKEDAEAANRAKDRFLAILSHELRTPLTPALITVSAHETDAALASEYREDLATVRRNLELEARLIDDLLDLNRLARAKIELRRQARDLHQVIENVLEICRAEAAAKGLVVHWEPTATEHNVNGDDGRLQQVFWNLLKNAVKFTPPGGNITVRSFNPRDGIVRIEVADTGIGINPEVIPRLFVAFEQGELGTKAQFGGLGLGLAICKALLDLHGGRIWAESTGPGKGATFTVEMPVTTSQVSMEYTARPAVHAATWEPKIGNHAPKILLVEDNEDTLRILSRLLEKTGCKITPVQSIKAALAAAERARERKEKFDLVISDLGLPDGDGRNLMRELHNRDGLSGIAISGFGMEEDIEKSRAAGFSKHLTKPIQIEELQAAISDLWEV